jgi:hypothetical protein
MKIGVLWDKVLWWLVNTYIEGDVLPAPLAFGSFGCLISVKILIFN